MKHQQLTWPVLGVALGLTACEEKPAADAPAAAEEAAKVADAAAKGAEGAAGAATAPTPPTPPPPPPPPPMPSAAEVCGEVVMALKSKNEAKFGGLATPATSAALANHEAKEHIIKSLAEGTCGAAKVEEDRALVTVALVGAAQDVPFVKLADGWKFDGVAYLEKYPVKSARAAKKGPAPHGKPKHKK